VGEVDATRLKGAGPPPGLRVVAGVVACWDRESLQELAKTHKNPLAQSVNVPFQFTTGFGVGAERRTGESLNVEPALPFPLTSGWSVVARPSLSLTYEPPPDEEFGLQDLQLSLYLTPAQTDRWIWGVGPIVQFPTATATGLGTGKWSAGPTGAVAYSNGPWFKACGRASSGRLAAIPLETR
jgi:hypothetical protein